MKPSIGRIVIYRFRPGSYNNGAAEAPAVVVRVWSDSCVNLKILMDGPFDYWKTSILQEQAVGGTTPGTWHWPVREEEPNGRCTR